MGIKQLTIVILVFILLSSSVSAVDFEWALGYPFKSVAYNPPDTWAMAGRNYFGLEPNGNYFAWRDTASSTPAITGRVESLPILLIATGGHYTTRYMCGGDRSDGCQQVINTKATYNGNVWYYNDCYAECSLNQNLYGIANEFIMWSTHANYKCDARDPDERCQDRIAYNVNYAPIVTAGFESVFPRDGIKAVGPVSDLIPSNLLPENETVYLGLFAKNQKDVLFWFGPSESEPTDPLKKETTDYFDYINYCSDLNHNNICDYTDGAPCYDEGADWYGDPDWVQGVCCGADPV
ncbi:hypothetical protein KY310_03040, partial [Candidatus Woesearchaeota archaeon]|nr:hypothetical protein [Candidatus Woesearchaeota archaeon]